MTFMSGDPVKQPAGSHAGGQPPYSEAMRAIDALANSISPVDLRRWLKDRVQGYDFDLLCLCEATEDVRTRAGTKPDAACKEGLITLNENNLTGYTDNNGSAEFRMLLSERVLPAMLHAWEQSCEMAKTSLRASCPKETFDSFEFFDAYDFTWVPLFVGRYYDWTNEAMNPGWVAATQAVIDSVIEHKYLADTVEKKP